jgi:hypothetical protein
MSIVATALGLPATARIATSDDDDDDDDDECLSPTMMMRS